MYCVWCDGTYCPLGQEDQYTWMSDDYTIREASYYLEDGTPVFD